MSGQYRRPKRLRRVHFHITQRVNTYNEHACYTWRVVQSTTEHTSTPPASYSVRFLAHNICTGQCACCNFRNWICTVVDDCKILVYSLADYLTAHTLARQFATLRHPSMDATGQCPSGRTLNGCGLNFDPSIMLQITLNAILDRIE